ncbi:hypothetical protein MAUB1S_11603 [Mycolicibacterium aubagnense]
MAELSESNSLKSEPTCFIAIIDGASCGDIETERILPTSSRDGTIVLTRTTMPTQARITGIARVRMSRGIRGR